MQMTIFTGNVHEMVFMTVRNVVENHLVASELSFRFRSGLVLIFVLIMLCLAYVRKKNK